MRTTKQSDKAGGSMLEIWLSGTAAKAYDAFEIDPSQGRSSQDVRSALASAHARAIEMLPRR